MLASQEVSPIVTPDEKGGERQDMAFEPTIIKGSDIDPKFNWKRALGAPGHPSVDFEERVDFRRLHNTA